MVGVIFVVVSRLTSRSSSALDACAGSPCFSADVASQQAPAVVAPAGTAVCPYCTQDPDAWVRLTKVPPPAISGTNAAVLDGACGKMVFGLHPDERRPPASIAKIVTAIVAADQGKLTDRVEVKVTGWELAVADGSSIAGLEAGMNLSIEDLLQGLLLPSGNDAALAIADHFGGTTRFVSLMNERVRRLGLKNSQFGNPDGRDTPASYTSALDIALLGRELMANPDLRRVVGTKTTPARWDGHLLWNTNYLVYGFEGATGVKFGYTEAAHETIVGAAVRGGRELYVSVLYSDFAYLDAVKLLNWAFTNTMPSCPAQ